MANLRFLVLLPCLDQPCSSAVAEIHAAAGRVVEVPRADLPAADERHNEPIRQCTELFSKVERK